MTGNLVVMPRPGQRVFSFAIPDTRKCISQSVFRRMILLSHMVWHVHDDLAWRLGLLKPPHQIVQFFAQASRETMRVVGGFSVSGRVAYLGPATILHIISVLNRLGLQEEMSSDELFHWQREGGAANDTKHSI